jgi:hypothetical protein
MILLNFSHPITDEQKAQIEALIHQPVEGIIHIPAQFDHQQPYLPQLTALVEQIPLEPQTLQSAPLLVNLPSFNVIAALLLAELHGRMGYFPPIVRLKPVEGAVPPRYEAAEILNLQGVRDAARNKRF